MTHAFFKALLFLAAGAVIHCLHHEHNIFKMGGLRKKLPVVFWSFLIGSAALAALPMTSGFFSKDQILLSAYNMHGVGPWLWAGGLLGALLTAIYSFRLVFVVFWGEAKTEPDRALGWRMAGPLAMLCIFAFFGGWIALPLGNVFPTEASHHVPHIIEAVSIGIPLLGLLIAWLVYAKQSLSVSGFTDSSVGTGLRKFWHGGWGMDTAYNALLVTPYKVVSTAMRNEWIDYIYHAVVTLCVTLHAWFSKLQTGRMRWYATSMVFGLILLIFILARTV
jgi:NADH-quinone oxidoreductase subunit L